MTSEHLLRAPDTVPAADCLQTSPGTLAALSPTVYPKRAYAYFVIAILMIVSFQSRLDQQMPALLVEPLKKAFQLSDTQMSLVQGMAFAFFYAVMGPICGIFIDRYNRRNLIICGLLTWSCMTVWSGLAGTYQQLLISRMGVGIGEAILAPAAYSLIADYIRPAARGRALGIYMTSFAAGGGFSFIIGGVVLGAVEGAPLVYLPVIGNIAPWQLAFISVALPGFLVALLMLFVREPIRKEDGSTESNPELVTYGDFLRYIRSNIRLFVLVTLSISSMQYVINTMLAWMPTLLQRNYHIPVRDIGLILGIMFTVCSVSGFLLSGVASDHWVKQKDLSGRLKPMMLSSILLIPTLATWPIVGNFTICLIILGIAILAVSVAVGTLPTTLQEMAPNRMRGQLVTLAMLVGSIIGWGGGPIITALITDYVFKDEAAIGYSLVVATVPAALLTLVTVRLALKPYAIVRERILGFGAAASD